MRAPPENANAALAGGGAAEKTAENVWTNSLSATAAPRQLLAELTGALAFLGFWKTEIESRIGSTADDVDLDDLDDIPSEAAAWLRAARAFQDWRAAA